MMMGVPVGCGAAQTVELSIYRQRETPNDPCRSEKGPFSQ